MRKGPLFLSVLAVAGLCFGQDLCKLPGQGSGFGSQTLTDADGVLDEIGKVVPFRSRSFKLFATLSPLVKQKGGAAAQLCNGVNGSERWIFYDPAYIDGIRKSGGDLSRYFVLAHETAHHVNGDTLLLDNVWPKDDEPESGLHGRCLGDAPRGEERRTAANVRFAGSAGRSKERVSIASGTARQSHGRLRIREQPDFTDADVDGNTAGMRLRRGFQRETGAHHEDAGHVPDRNRETDSHYRRSIPNAGRGLVVVDGYLRTDRIHRGYAGASGCDCLPIRTPKLQARRPPLWSNSKRKPRSRPGNSARRNRLLPLMYCANFDGDSAGGAPRVPA